MNREQLIQLRNQKIWELQQTKQRLIIAKSRLEAYQAMRFD